MWIFFSCFKMFKGNFKELFGLVFSWKMKQNWWFYDFATEIQYDLNLSDFTWLKNWSVESQTLFIRISLEGSEDSNVKSWNPLNCDPINWGLTIHIFQLQLPVNKKSVNTSVNKKLPMCSTGKDRTSVTSKVGDHKVKEPRQSGENTKQPLI